MYQNINWHKAKLSTSIIAAIGLMVISAISFNSGLNFGGDWGWLITIALWVSFTIIQFIGNDMENHDDWVFTALWVFTYMVGIGAGSWAIYSFINIPNEIIRWIAAIGLAGSAEIAPERLIVKFLKSGVMNGMKRPSMPKPLSERPSSSQPKYVLPQGNPKKSTGYTPTHKPSDNNNIRRTEPTYSNNFNSKQARSWNTFQPDDEQ